jgi:hypothetical protein
MYIMPHSRITVETKHENSSECKRSSNECVKIPQDMESFDHDEKKFPWYAWKGAKRKGSKQHLTKPRAMHRNHLCQDKGTVEVNDPQISTKTTCKKKHSEINHS